MFTWICPTCGREVPPSMSECRNCAQKPAEAQVAAPPVVAPPQPVQPQQVYQQPVIQQQPMMQQMPPQAAAPQPQYQAAPPPEPRGYAPAPAPTYQTVSYLAPPVQQAQGLPSWLITLLVFGGLLGLGAAFYFFYLPSTKRESSESAKVESAESASEGAKISKLNPLTKQLEVTGLRITEDARKKLQVRMIVINHSSADMGEVKLIVTLSSAAGNGQPTVLGKFPLTVSDLGPMEAKETKGSLTTNLRAYELPDWQFLRATAEIVE